MALGVCSLCQHHGEVDYCAPFGRYFCDDCHLHGLAERSALRGTQSLAMPRRLKTPRIPLSPARKNRACRSR